MHGRSHDGVVLYGVQSLGMRQIHGVIVVMFYFLHVPMYCLYHILNICEICAWVIHLVFLKRLDLAGLFGSHMYTYGMVFVAREMSA